MGDNSTEKELPVQSVGQGDGARVVYVMPQQAFAGTDDDEISLRELWDIAWRGKWLVIAITALFAAGSVAYALLAEEWYRSEVLLAPADEKSTSGLSGQLGGLAALAGVSVGGGDSSEALAVLNSREFAAGFIKEFDLLPVFYADEWNGASNQWLGNDPEEWPDIRDAVKYFHDHVLSVRLDRQSGLVTLAIEWTDPQVAAEWAEILVRRLNSRLRERALKEAETNVSYLQAELGQTSVVTLQQSIGRLLESELQKLMLARGNEEFAFRIIDNAAPPKDRIRPKRSLIAVLGTLMGGVLALFAVFIRHALRSGGKADSPQSSSS
jgi:uncharacterized protein involved in exopolysaccharide biosynthesis